MIFPSDNSGNVWRKSTFSQADGACLEAGPLADGTVGVRDSKIAYSPILKIDRRDWNIFVIRVRTGDFDL